MLCFVLGWINVAQLCIPVSLFFICGAKPTWRQEYRILIKKKTWRQGAYHVHSDGALCFISPLQPLQTSQLHTTIMRGITLCCIFCCLLQYYSMLHASVWYIVPAPCPEWCKCKVGSCPKLSCCFLCFLEREGRDMTLECWKLLPWFLGTFCCTFLVGAMSISQLKVLLKVFN